MSARAAIRLAFALGLSSVPSSAVAEPRVLRMATVAPDGTAWARVLKTFGRDLDVATKGHVRIKWYWGGVAGDELTVGERIRKEQLDGVASGGMLCERLAPSLRVTRLAGLFQARAETRHVLEALFPTLHAEALRAGFELLGTAGVGAEIIFSRVPVQTFSELKRIKLWRWDLDEVGIMTSRAMGLPSVPAPLEEAGKLYESGRSDGFMAVPSAAIAFQWSAQSQYVTTLGAGYVQGCLLVSSRAFDPLTAEDQQQLRALSRIFLARFDEVSARQDELLLGGVFSRQGLKTLKPSDAFRSEFLAASKDARERLGERLVPRELLDRVLALLADYRAEHRGRSPGIGQ